MCSGLYFKNIRRAAVCGCDIFVVDFVICLFITVGGEGVFDGFVGVVGWLVGYLLYTTVVCVKFEPRGCAVVVPSVFAVGVGYGRIFLGTATF